MAFFLGQFFSGSVTQEVSMARKMNFHRYTSYPVMGLKDRTWPDNVITKAPQWCSVDLRDGNQALQNPMNLEQKLEMFQLLVEIGFKEIEVGFPSSSEVDYDFMRILIEDHHIPNDVTVQVLTQAREHLIRKTFESLSGVKKAVIHLYNSTSTNQRRVVFRKNKEEIKQLATYGARLIKKLADKEGNPGISYEYSPESFTGTEMDYALDVCNGVIDVFNPTEDHPLIINLPATIEMATPNVYADQIEWFNRNLNKREAVVLSLHTHNDRGTSVAASELALMAGADRVEGTLFGNGERTGNLDLVTMALNMFSQGVDPQLDFSGINRVRDIYRRTTGMAVHERHPYVGDLVYTAFSGSHQDAINKGFKERELKPDAKWDVPYLPVDPADMGRSYKSIVRINSQSGKGGTAYIMDYKYGYRLPKQMHPEFAKVVQGLSEKIGVEVGPEHIYNAFEDTYLKLDYPFSLNEIFLQMDAHKGEKDHVTILKGKVSFKEECKEVHATGNGPVEAFVHGISETFDIEIRLRSFDEHAINQGADSNAVAYVGIEGQDEKLVFGVGIDSSIAMASLKALISALNRSFRPI